MHPNAESIGEDRRAHRRYEMSLRLSYQIGKGPAVSGTGMVRDISSSGIAFTCDKPLAAGARITLLVEWPTLVVPSDRKILRAVGHVVRSDANGIAMRCSRRCFRTDGKCLRQDTQWLPAALSASTKQGSVSIQ